MKTILPVLLAALLAACAPANTLPIAATETLAATASPEPGQTALPASAATTESSPATGETSLPAPSCENGLTPSQTEGPYYTPDSPERQSLLEPGMPGQIVRVTGYVLDANCQPLPNAWLDFWQADANGAYDNNGYTLRGHQFTDAQGRYFLETVIPGEYPGRTPHIHVKVRAAGSSNTLTSQLYFPDAAANQFDFIFSPALLVQMEETENGLLAYFNFVISP